MKRTAQNQSILDLLVRIMPDWKNRVVEFRQSPRFLSQGPAAKSLFALWKDETNKKDGRILKRPNHISASDVKQMADAGLVKDLGNEIEITKMGSDVIQTMILGDDRSIWEDTSEMSLETAYANTKVRSKTAKKHASKQLEDVDNQDEEKDLEIPVSDEEDSEPQSVNWYKKLKKHENYHDQR
jgi:hypothetical protein